MGVMDEAVREFLGQPESFAGEVVLYTIAGVVTLFLFGGGYVLVLWLLRRLG